MQQRLSVNGSGNFPLQQKRPAHLDSDALQQKRPSFLDPDAVQSIQPRLSVCSAISHTASRRTSRIDCNLSVDMGIPIYQSLSDSENGEDDMEQNSQIRREAGFCPRHSQQSLASSRLSFSWVPSPMSTVKSAAWGTQLHPWASDQTSGSEQVDGSIDNSSAVQRKANLESNLLDFVMRPSQEPAQFSDDPADVELGQAARQATSRYQRIRRTMFFVLEHPFGSKAAMAVSATCMSAIFVGIAIAILAYIPNCRHHGSSCRLYVFEWVICVFYSSEVALRFWCCPRVCGFLTYLPNVVDVLSSLECMLSMMTYINAWSEWPIIKLMRHFEVGLRLLKLSRYSSSWQLLCATLMDSAPALLLPLAAYVILVALGAGLLLVAERGTSVSDAAGAEAEAFSGLYDAVLFCMFCLTSTDTGPFYRLEVQSPAGHVIVGFLLVCGHIIFAMPITIVGTCFCRTWFQRDRVLFTKVVRRRLKLQSAEVSETLHQLFSRFTNADADVLGFDEFKRFVAAIIPSPSAEKVLELFSTFDQDQDGYIGFHELYATIYPEADPDLWGVLMADATGNADIEQLPEAAESDLALGTPQEIDDQLGAVCKMLQSFERRFVEMLEQRLRFLERDQHTLAAPPWVAPLVSSSSTTRREQQMIGTSWPGQAASSSFVARPSGNSSLIARASGSGSSCFSPKSSIFSPRPSFGSTFSPRPSVGSTLGMRLCQRPSVSSSFTGTSLWSLLPTPSANSVRTSRVSQSSLRGQHMLGSFTSAGSISFLSDGAGCRLHHSGLEQPAARDVPQKLHEMSAAAGAELERSRTFPMMPTDHEAQADSSAHPASTAQTTGSHKSFLKPPGEFGESVRSALRSNSAPEMRRGPMPCSPRSGPPSGHSSRATTRENSPASSRRQSVVSNRPTLKRQLTLTRIRNRSSMEEDDDLTPALQPNLSGHWRLLTMKNAAEVSPAASPKGSPKGSPRSTIKASKDKLHASPSPSPLSPSGSLTSPTSDGVSSTLVSVPISVPIPDQASGWRKRWSQKAFAAKKKVSERARRWNERPRSAGGHSRGSLSSSGSGSMEDGQA